MNLKRLIDIIVGLAGIVVAAPIMITVAIILKLQSKGPVIYRCKRIGRFGEHFDMFKFRTMVENADSIDCKLCVNSDVRVTGFGSLLRRTKLNELPQLFNVVKGDMSLVGPRPEDPKFMDHYKDQWDIVLRVRPGIMGPNQILHRNEEDMFPPEEDPERFYLEKILPEKLKRDIDYVGNCSTWSDIVLLTKGVLVSIFRADISARAVSQPEFLWQLLTDTVLSVMAYMAAYYMRFDTLSFHDGNLYSLSIILAANPLIFALTGLYRRSRRFFSVPDLWLIVRVATLSAAVLIIGSAFMTPLQYHSRAVFFLYPLILLGCLGGSRIAQQLILEKLERKPLERSRAQNVIIYGAGRLGVETAKRLEFEPGINTVGFVDDDPLMRNRMLLGIRVMGGSNDLKFLKTLHQIDKVFIAFNPQSRRALSMARQRCIQAGLTDVLIRSDIPPTPGKQYSARNYFRGIRLSDTLGIEETRLEAHKLRTIAEGGAVAIVGAGDNFGEQLCRELLPLKISKLIVIEECQARLGKLTHLFNSIQRSGASFLPYFHPIGLHDMTEEVLKEHDVKWLIYNRINRPTTAASLNMRTLIFANFVDIVRYIGMAKRLKWDYFTYLSPYLKDCFCLPEKSLHLLTENYVSYAAKTITANLATVRVPNVLENENELFMTACDKAANDKSFQISQEKLHFTSARYAARLILNSLLLHNCGSTLAVADGVSIDLRTLMDFYFEKEVKGKLHYKRDSSGVGIHHTPTKLGHRYCGTTVQNIVRLEEQEFANPYDHEKLIGSIGRYLSHEEKQAVDEFVCHLKLEKSRQHPLSLPSPREAAFSQVYCQV